MNSDAPEIRALTQHLAECPEIFLAEPVQPSGQGSVNVAAVLCDLLDRHRAPRLTLAEADRFRYTSKKAVAKERPYLRLALLSSWVFSHPSLLGAPPQQLRDWFFRGLRPLAELVSVEELVSDSERREELVRCCLDAVSLVPAGESENQARNRLSALSSVERAQVVEQARQAEERARKVREEMARERARQAAAVYSRE